MRTAWGILAAAIVVVTAVTANARPIKVTDADDKRALDDVEFQSPVKVSKVASTASLKPLGKDRVVRIAINNWSGWAPLIWANKGAAPAQVWKDSKGKPFQVELVVEDSWRATVDKVAAADVHVAWSTVDLLPLVAYALGGDRRTQPRVFQLVDWSNGGDGLVVRDGIKQIGDLKGKRIVVAQHSPSYYFLASMLAEVGLSPSDVIFVFVKDAAMASRAFATDKKIDAAITWQPALAKLGGQKGNRILVTTREASRMIASTWYARADFAKANPAIIEGLVRGMLEAQTALDAEVNRNEAAKLVDSVFKLPPNSSANLVAELHLANHAENRTFFDKKSPTGFDSTYAAAAKLHVRSASIDAAVEKLKLADGAIVTKLGRDQAFVKQVDTYPGKLARATNLDFDQHAFLTKTVAINFFPNSHELFKKVPDSKNPKKEVLYDTNIDRSLGEIAALAARFPSARLEIGGHTDASMKGYADESLVNELSSSRAIAVRDALIDKYKLDPEQLVAKGFGWSRPKDPADPGNHARNRRVEIRVHAIAP